MNLNILNMHILNVYIHIVIGIYIISTSNPKVLLVEIKDDLNNVHKIAKLNIVGMTILHKLICRFNTIPIKIPVDCFVEIKYVY
jgi:hypothetical protein